MSGRISPFAALTGAEQQIKWLEYQSIRLPYVNNRVDMEDDLSVDTIPAKQAPPAPAKGAQKAEEKAAPAKAPIQDRSANDFQKIRHKQYDAIISRMKQAELRTGGFNSFT